jgi:hypothetical protein
MTIDDNLVDVAILPIRKSLQTEIVYDKQFGTDPFLSTPSRVIISAKK